MCRYLSTISDTGTIGAISQEPTLEAFALKTLGITEQDLLILKGEKKDKREYLRSVVANSNPSFGRFMTQVYLYYQGLRSSGKRGSKNGTLSVTDPNATVKMLQRKVRTWTADSVDNSDIFELCVLAYRLSRAKAE